MPKSTLAGHPLHPMLIVAPAALIPFGFILDAMYRATGKSSYSNAAYYSLAGGIAAAGAGVMDYLTIQPETDVKRTANMHAILNVSALALTAANVIRRNNLPEHQGGSIAMSALAAAGVLISGWFGGKMVYEQGMRVRGVDPVAQAPDLAPPRDAAIEQVFHRAERAIPAAGPHT